MPGLPINNKVPLSSGISSNRFDGPYYQEKKRMKPTHEYINKIKDELPNVEIYPSP